MDKQPLWKYKNEIVAFYAGLADIHEIIMYFIYDCDISFPNSNSQFIQES